MELVDVETKTSSEKIVQQSENLQVYIKGLTSDEKLHNGKLSNIALKEINRVFGKSLENEKIFDLVGKKLDYNSLVKSREKASVILRNISYVQNMENTIDLVSDITDVTADYVGPQAVYHFHSLGEQLD